MIEVEHIHTRPAADSEFRRHASTDPADSLLSASIYCTEVDRLIVDVVRPFRRLIGRGDPDAGLWMLRYGLRGPHLKLRILLNETVHDTGLFRHHLETLTADFFSNLGETPDGRERHSDDRLPPIEPEDHLPGLADDRSLIWTRYQYKPSHVGAMELSSLPRFEQLYARCLIATADILLDALGDRSWTSREAAAELEKRSVSLAFDLLAVAVEQIGPTLEERLQFARFTRDWLARAALDPSRLMEIVDAKVEAQAGRKAQFLARATSAPTRVEAWSTAVHDLLSYCRESRVDADRGIDSPLLLVLARLTHNAINPLGVNLGNQVFLCQLTHSMLSASCRTEGVE